MLRTRINAFMAVSGVIAIIATSSLSSAAPYASGLRNTSGSMWEFVLNQGADNVSILRDGGNPLNPGSLGAGRHSFDMGAFNNFEISVTHSASAGFTKISDTNNLFTNFERPSGMTVNTNPTSSHFGMIYVNNSNTAATGGAIPRAMGDGIYSLTADRVGVNASSFAAIADPQDITQAILPPGWNVSGTPSSAWRMALDETDNLIVSDWSDDWGGIKYASPDLVNGGLILDIEGGPPGGVINNSFEPIHGSITSKPIVSGSVGNNLTVWAMDEDLETLNGSKNSVWRWDVGSATDYDGAPQLEINTSKFGTSLENPPLGEPGLWSTGSFYQNVHYSPQHNKFYLTNHRFDGFQAGLIVITPDGIDGETPIVEWNSLDFSIKGADGIAPLQPGDNGDGLDSWLDDVACNPGSEGTQDVFRYAASSTMSADGTELYVHRGGIPPLEVGGCSYENIYAGQNSNLPGAVLVIPLDANGIPDIDIDDGGTPSDPLDDQLSNLQSIEIAANNNYHTRTEVSLDVAGNVYITNNVSELLEVFSVGGNTRATTTGGSAPGTFMIEEVTGPACDLDGNGTCDKADLRLLYDEIAAGTKDNDDIPAWLAEAGTENGVVYLAGDANLDGSVGGQDFTDLAFNFGNIGIDNVDDFDNAYWDQGNFDGNLGGQFAVGGPDFTGLALNFGHVSVNSVPEPASLAMFVLLAGGLLIRKRCRK